MLLHRLSFILSLFCCLYSVLAVGPRSACGACVSSTCSYSFLGTFLFSGTTRCSGLTFSLLQPWKQPLFQGILIPFIKRMVFRTSPEIWALGVRIATLKCQCFSVLSVDRVRKYLCTLDGPYTLCMYFSCMYIKWEHNLNAL